MSLTLQQSPATELKMDNFLKKADEVGISGKSMAVRRAEQINIFDSNAVLTYGSDAATRVAAFSDNILKQVKSRDTGEIGKKLTDIIIKAKGLDTTSLSKKGFFQKLFGNAEAQVQKFMADFDTIADQIEAVAKELGISQAKLMERIKELDELYDLNLQQFIDLNIYLEAGKIKLADCEKEVQRLSAEVGQDAQKAQELADLKNAIKRFEKRLTDLALIKTNALQTGPQIRLIQENSLTLAQKIQTTHELTIPLWKRSFVIALALNEQKAALELENMVNDANNALLLQNAQLLHETSVGVAQANQRTVIDIETIEKVHEEFKATFAEVAKIEEDGAKHRAEVEKKLETINGEIIGLVKGK